MLVMIKREDFDALNDTSLIWTCIEPTILKIRGKSFTIKSEAYAHLSPGQRALLMFQVLYGHTFNGVEEFFLHQSYLLTNKDVWSQMKKGIQYFGDNKMVEILEKMDLIYQNQIAKKWKDNAEQYHALITDINKDVELSESLSNLNKSFGDALPISIKLVASYIRDNEGEFVQFIQ